LISAVLRLGLLLALAWWAARQWPYVGDLMREASAAIMQWSGLNPTVALLFALVLLLTVARVLTLPLWLSPVPLDRRAGVLRHPFPPRPLRIHLRFRRTRFFVLVLLEVWILIAAWKTLLALGEPTRAIELPGLGYGDWLDAALAQALVQVAVLLIFYVLHWLCLRTLSVGTPKVGFVRYQIEHAPVQSMFVRLVLGVHLPILVLFSAWAPQPQAPLLGIASVFALGTVSLLAVVLTLAWERRKDNWLRNAWQGHGKPSATMSARELAGRCIAFLQPGRVAGLDGPIASEPSPPLSNFVAPVAPPVASQTVPAMNFRAAANHDLDQPSPFAADGSAFAHQAQTSDAPAPVGPDVEALHPDSALGVTAFDNVVLPPSVGRLALDRAEQHLDQEQLRAARRALREAIAIGDANERAEAEQLLPAAGGGFPWRVSIALCTVTVCASLIGVGWQWLQLPSIDETRALARSAHVHVRKSGGPDNTRLSLLGNRYDYSLNTGLDNISEHFVNAVIASEDRRFRSHGPVYIAAKFVQAGLFCVARKLNVFSSATGCAGNSTIPQQLARNLFLSESRSITRKLKELLWAIKIELGFSKDEILGFYLNRLYLGRGNFGVELGARDYFHKSAAQLSLNEAAFLAAAIKRPGWNWREDRAGAIARAKIIVAVMSQQGYAPERAQFPTNFRPVRGNRTPTKPYLGHLWQWIQPGVKAALRGLPNGDYKVVTSLNAELEVYAEFHLEAQVRRLRSAGVNASQGAAVIMRPGGQVLALVGGVGDSLNARGFNRAKRTTGMVTRPPASAFKPFIYLTALRKGLTPSSRINARPVSINVAGDPKLYQPQNYDRKPYADVTMREGLVNSINTAAVRLLHDELGFDALFDTLDRLGLPTSEINRQWGLALGSQGISLIEMAGAYAVFANGGRAVTPSGFSAITTADGRVVWRARRTRTARVFKAAHIESLDSMLRDVVAEGTGQRAAYKVPSTYVVAGKTGTGDSFVDAWFIGYTKDLVIGVWIGNDRPQSMRGVFGGTAPTRAFNAMLRDIIKHTDLAKTE